MPTLLPGAQAGRATLAVRAIGAGRWGSTPPLPARESRAAEGAPEGGHVEARRPEAGRPERRPLGKHAGQRRAGRSGCLHVRWHVGAGARRPCR